MQTLEFSMAVLTGRTIRKFINKLRKVRPDITATIDKPNHKRLTSEDVTIFSALKYSTGWDCRVRNDLVGVLKSCL